MKSFFALVLLFAAVAHGYNYGVDRSFSASDREDLRKLDEYMRYQSGYLRACPPVNPPLGSPAVMAPTEVPPVKPKTRYYYGAPPPATSDFDELSELIRPTKPKSRYYGAPPPKTSDFDEESELIRPTKPKSRYYGAPPPTTSDFDEESELRPTKPKSRYYF